MVAVLLTTCLNDIKINTVTLAVVWSIPPILYSKLIDKVIVLGTATVCFLPLQYRHYHKNITLYLYTVSAIQILTHYVLHVKVFHLFKNINKINIKQLHLFTFSLIFASAVGALLSAAVRDTLRYNPQQTYWKRFIIWFSADSMLFCSIIPWLMSLPTIKSVRSKKPQSIILTLLILAFVPIPISFSKNFSSEFTLVSMLCLDFALSLLCGYMMGYIACTTCTLLITTTVKLSYAIPHTSSTKEFAYFEKLLALTIFLVILHYTTLLFTHLILERDEHLCSIEKIVEVRTKELKNARKRAEELALDKSHFMAFLCHELRNPLHAVINLTRYTLHSLC